ncbi:MAG: sigma 54-interacting transcriptional regulator [Tissierellia bacterium]|nr:sigma 54-interacting transcriptional regulator [Tissierellia bacterium]
MQRYDLQKIANEIQDYAEAVSKIANVEVEVVDRNLKRIAGTGYYKDKIGLDMSDKGYVNKHVIDTKELIIITDPGENELCINCPDRDNCVESFEVTMPIIVEDYVIGVLGLIGLTDYSKDMFDANPDNYLDFVRQIASFISALMINYYTEEDIRTSVEALKAAVSYLDQAVLVLDSEGRIKMCNKSAKSQLELEEDYEEKKVVYSSLGDEVGDGNEYSLEYDDKKKFVVGSIIKLDNKDLNKLLIFNTIKKVKANLYDMTSTFDTGDIIGSSDKTKKMLSNIKKMSKSTSTVLITGESGTGKELIETTIWKNSDRANNLFISINCAAIPETLLESELFGYTKGAFTGADSKGKIGKFELANNGIIFLDEIGDMPIYLQSKILRVLENRVVTRLGSNKEIPLDIRVIAATNKDLKQKIKEGRFRDDLYYRLNVIPIEAAPLRERPADILDLTYFFINRYSNLFEKKFVKIENEVIDRLMEYSWPGNVRELENSVEFMINMMGSDGVLNLDTLPNDIFMNQNINTHTEIKPLALLEKNEIEKALNIHGRTTEGKQYVAKELGIGIATLYRKISLYGIE